MFDSSRVLAHDTGIEPVGPYAVTISNGPDRVRWRKQIVAPANVGTMSIHVQISSASPGPAWELQFLALGVVRDVITSDSARGRSVEAWSSDISGNVVVIVLVADRPPNGLSIVIDKYDHPVTPTVPQAIEPGQNHMQSIFSVTNDIQKLGSAVARLRIKTNVGQALCTGFLVSDSLMLTNFHCISTGTEAVNTQADFGFDRSGQPPSTFRVQGIEVINSDLAYDYVVVRVLGNPGKTYSHIAVPALGDRFFPVQAPPLGSISFPDSTRNLLVIEHPGGGPKMVSMTKCAVVSDKMSGYDPQELSDFGHKCNTLGGSSGSPVFSMNAKVLVGLHHLGFVKGSDPKDPLLNQAVYIGYILEDIRNQSPTVYAEIVSDTNKQ
ncbi:MAG: trypsin-like peptidase domain-containing protein [Silvibacterium sp.]